MPHLTAAVRVNHDGDIRRVEPVCGLQHLLDGHHIVDAALEGVLRA
jgi:hypothetical protein